MCRFLAPTAFWRCYSRLEGDNVIQKKGKLPKKEAFPFGKDESFPPFALLKSPTRPIPELFNLPYTV
ncbi:hypothetical protein TREPR_1875 [Treponema primitia ZAS-2]|uniref:Uncharacterized protein n=1 Tax=Treponema primitia (strain ATCC BAA-887 / DSM 12427 / ZAS-2) TaxID=545694 RepID=F5YL55_TREPZ|nr:hypothetical protein TREPR_1875 [Treponema primitia ZAS-2]